MHPVLASRQGQDHAVHRRGNRGLERLCLPRVPQKSTQPGGESHAPTRLPGASVAGPSLPRFSVASPAPELALLGAELLGTATRGSTSHLEGEGLTEVGSSPHRHRTAILTRLTLTQPEKGYRRAVPLLEICPENAASTIHKREADALHHMSPWSTTQP